MSCDLLDNKSRSKRAENLMRDINAIRDDLGDFSKRISSLGSQTKTALEGIVKEAGFPSLDDYEQNKGGELVEQLKSELQKLEGEDDLLDGCLQASKIALTASTIFALGGECTSSKLDRTRLRIIYAQ